MAAGSVVSFAGINVSRDASRLLIADPALAEDLQAASTSFGSFLQFWHFRNGESRRDEILGETIWPGQQRVVDAMETEDWIITPKARKTGLTTLACAYAGFVLRFQDDSVVSAISYRIDASTKLRDAVLYGLRRLPEHLRLPIQSTKTTITVQGGGHLEAWPATERAQADISATHTLVDELGRWIAPASTWQALSPSIAGTCHVVSTSPGPESFMASLYRSSAAGDSGYFPVFVSALDRPDRDLRWYEAQKRALGGLVRAEYPLSVEDVLMGTGERFFQGPYIDAATKDAIEPDELPEVYRQRRPRSFHEFDVRGRDARIEVFEPVFTAGVDVGVSDAFVVTVLEHSTDITDVVCCDRVTGYSYPEMEKHLKNTRASFHGVHIAVESNNAGAALIQNLPFAVEARWTSARSKSEMLWNLEARLAEQTLKISSEFSHLLDELRMYAVPDEHLVQDCVMSLAIGLAASYERPRPGKILGVMYA